MSLNWSVRDIKDHETLCYITAEKDIPYGPRKGERYLNPVTDTLIWGTMIVGMGSITAKNWKKFYYRISFMEKMVGAYRYSQVRGPIYLTPKDIQDHIGLHTNAVTETEAKWLKRVYELHAERCDRIIKDEEVQHAGTGQEQLDRRGE
jgi:hypothetical protein